MYISQRLEMSIYLIRIIDAFFLSDRKVRSREMSMEATAGVPQGTRTLFMGHHVRCRAEAPTGGENAIYRLPGPSNGGSSE